MILTFQDDACVHVWPSVDAVVHQIEALDIEDCVRAVFDERGQRYVVEWIKPNKRGWIGCSNGEYRLVASGEPDPDALAAWLDRVEMRCLPPENASTLQGIRRALARSR